jgi:hypothetical protein
MMVTEEKSLQAMNRLCHSLLTNVEIEIRGTKMTADRVDELMDFFRHVTETEEVRHVWKDGEYLGQSVVYKNPLHPDLKEVFHPYMPLVVTGVVDPNTFEPIAEVPLPRLTREYFIKNGLPVPGEGYEKMH